jgi:hypothetical protein
VAERPNAPVLKTDSTATPESTQPIANSQLACDRSTPAPPNVPVSVRVALENHPELGRLIDAWPTLPATMRTAILTLAVGG